MMDRTTHLSFGPSADRRALILPVVLLVIALLALLGSSFAWLAQADLAAGQASAHEVNARLTAESGIQRILVLLRSNREEFDRWYNNIEELGEQLVWIPGEEDEGITGENRTVEDLEEEEPAWLYSIVADDPDSDEPLSIRFGLTDEASKLNLNIISGKMLVSLILETVPNPEELDIEVLKDSFLDWRDEDEEPRAEGAEKNYYDALRPPYAPTNGRFRTVEELLMVRGFTSEILYGEDQNRNGILDPNEDDGEGTFPNDDGDGQLRRGIYPYLTVFSREMNVSQSGQAKIDVNSANEAALATVTSADIARYLVVARSNGIVFTSFEELVNAPAVTTVDTDETIENPITVDDIPALQDVLTLNPPIASGTPTGEGDTGEEDQPGAEDGGTGDAGLADADGDGLPKEAPEAPPGAPMIEGRVNVNTAPAVVLRALDIFTDEEVTNIIAARRDLDDEQRASTAWLTSTGAVSSQSMAAAAPYLTTRAEQFTIESIGYAHHLGVMCRLQAVVEMRFQVVPYFMYYRDISSLGAGYPVHQLLKDREEGERTFARTRQSS